MNVDDESISQTCDTLTDQFANQETSSLKLGGSTTISSTGSHGSLIYPAAKWIPGGTMVVYTYNGSIGAIILYRQ